MAQRTSRASQIAAEMETEILRSGAGPGERVALRKDLLARFATSPSVINEALRILRDKELIIVRPGAHGGIFVSEDVQWLQLGGINMWFRQAPGSPRELFEARTHLEDTLARVALSRIVPDDLRSIEWAFEGLRDATASAGEYWAANTQLHMAIGRASKLPVLFEMYQALVITLNSSLMHAEFVGGYKELLEHNVQVHADLVSALRDGRYDDLEKALKSHRVDLIRADDTRWSPQVAN